MRAIILAGGEGTRLREIIHDLPKPMAPVDGKPFLEYLVLFLVNNGIREIILSVGYKAENIKSFFKTGEPWNAHIVYSEERAPLGTAGALKLALKLSDGSNCIVLNGDSFFKVDFKRLVYFHRSRKSIFTIQLRKSDVIGRYGKVEIDAEGSVLAFNEKDCKGSGLINGGVYICDKEIISIIPDGKVSLEEEIFPSLVGKGLFGMPANGYFMDIGIPKDYLTLCRNPARLK